MNLIITFDDTLKDRILDAVCANYNFDPSSQITKKEFVKGIILKLIKDNVKTYESTLAGNTALKIAADKADSEIIIT